MECFVLTLTEVSYKSRDEHTILGVFFEQSEIYNLLFRTYCENPYKFEKQSLRTFENTDGAREIELTGEKNGKTFVFRAEYREEEELKGSMKEITNHYNIKI